MNSIKHCQNCNEKFNREAYKNIRLENGSVIINCLKCTHENIVIEKAVCGWPFFIKGPWDIGSGCNKLPLYVFPYKTLTGVEFRCICEEHIHRKHVIPFTSIISKEKRDKIEKLNMEKKPVAYNFFGAWAFFVIFFGPIMLLYSFAAQTVRFFGYTQISFMWLCLGLSWLIVTKMSFLDIPLPPGKNKRILKVWKIMFGIIIILEFTANLVLRNC